MDTNRTGLTAQQVAVREKNGQINHRPDPISKPLHRIFIDNLITPFNLFNILIAAALLLVGSYKNLTFFVIITANVAIGIIQEIRTKRTLEKLSVLTAAQATVLRDGMLRQIPADALVQDDLLCLRAGDQLCVDARLLDGQCEVNEALLTGEVEPIVKSAGDVLLSGSFVVSGHCLATAERVGKAAYAAELTEQAKAYKKRNCMLMRSIDRIIQIAGTLIVPIGALMAWDALVSGHSLRDTVTDVAAALIGMMPQGLVLLTTVSLVVGVLRLAKHKTLVQQLYCIETLSRVDTLCLDKTGTLTKGCLSVRQVLQLGDFSADKQALTAAALAAIADQNSTALALSSYFGKPAQPLSALAISPFSSARKYSAAAFDGVGTLLFGAPDVLCPDYPYPSEKQTFEQNGDRLLLISFSEQTDITTALHRQTPLALCVLEDEIRENAGDVLRFFRQQAVEIKILSGDNPATVSAIAKRVGFADADRFVDATTLHTPQALADAAAHYSIFGRVSPQQKKALVQAMQSAGHTVAMTGDGVNDVLALKEADCSIAVATGSDAARKVAQLVLLEDNFAALPRVVMEGRRVINNITRTASLFLVKTVMSLLLALCVILLPMGYPFEPIQLSLIGLFAESIPGFFLALEPNRERVRGSFLRTVFAASLPSALLICGFILLCEFVIAPLCGFTALQTTTLSFYIMGFVWLMQLHRLSKPFTTARRLLWCGMVIGFYGGALLLHRVLFSLCLPDIPMLIAFLLCALCAALLDKPFYSLCKRLLKAE